MSEPTEANEADVAEQQVEVDEEVGPAQEALPAEADPADVAEQRVAVPLEPDERR